MDWSKLVAAFDAPRQKQARIAFKRMEGISDYVGKNIMVFDYFCECRWQAAWPEEFCSPRVRETSIGCGPNGEKFANYSGNATANDLYLQLPMWSGA